MSRRRGLLATLTYFAAPELEWLVAIFVRRAAEQNSWLPKYRGAANAAHTARFANNLPILFAP